MINLTSKLGVQAHELLRWAKVFNWHQNFISNLDVLYNEMLACKCSHGVIHFTGIGKNIPMLIKVSSTLNSLSIPASVFNATDAVHGDLGTFMQNDILIAVSKSGNTHELISTINYMQTQSKKFCKTIIGVVFSKDAKEKTHCELSKVCDIIVELPPINEMQVSDIEDLVPTSSPLAFQMVFDSLSAELAEDTGFNKEHYKRNHPGGDIGKTLLSK
jgi:arabinose-5-phosphate isomerase